MNPRYFVLTLPILAACVVPRVHAQSVTTTVSRPAFDAFMTTVTGNSTTVGIGSGGTPVATRAPTALGGSSGWSYAGNFGVGANSTGALVSGTTTIPVGASKVPVTGTSKVVAASMGKALAKFAVRAVPIASTFAAVVALVGDVKVIMKAGQNGADNTFWVTDDGADAGHEYSHNNNLFFPTAQAACDRQQADLGPDYYGATVVNRSADQAPGCTITRMFQGNPRPYTYQLFWREAPITPGSNEREITADELATKIARESGWPDPKRLGNILAEAINSGQPVELEKPALTGPATAPGTSETKVTTNPHGTKVTTTTKVENPVSYQGDKATVKPKTTTTTTTTKPDGTSTTDTTTEEVPDSTKPEELPPTDTDLPELPELYKQKYPEGIKGVWNQRKDQMKATPLVALTSNLMPPASMTGGQCPQPISLDLSFGSWASYGSHQLEAPCAVWQFGGWVIVISALLLARALIFGG